MPTAIEIPSVAAEDTAVWPEGPAIHVQGLEKPHKTLSRDQGEHT
ncbi:hypothetical protein ABZS68_36895 [Streptomyces sp. NPDC005571]